ncbi:hypothetical protein BJ912DRAFT_927464 [Pholiota molesta]|nr:hypothetical protein BJ912DRAFT_927464 [Pholiota molesta]
MPAEARLLALADTPTDNPHPDRCPRCDYLGAQRSALTTSSHVTCNHRELDPTHSYGLDEVSTAKGEGTGGYAWRTFAADMLVGSFKIRFFTLLVAARFAAGGSGNQSSSRIRNLPEFDSGSLDGVSARYLWLFWLVFYVFLTFLFLTDGITHAPHLRGCQSWDPRNATAQDVVFGRSRELFKLQIYAIIPDMHPRATCGPQSIDTGALDNGPPWTARSGRVFSRGILERRGRRNWLLADGFEDPVCVFSVFASISSSKLKLRQHSKLLGLDCSKSSRFDFVSLDEP